MSRLKNMIRRILERTASSGDTGDRAEAKALLARLEAPAALFAAPQPSTKPARKPRKSRKSKK